jgi:hypothetical protein
MNDCQSENILREKKRTCKIVCEKERKGDEKERKWGYDGEVRFPSI